MAIWDKGGSFTRKKIGTILLKDPKADRRDVEDALRNSGYDEVTDVTDRLRIEGVIKEGEDQIPGGLAKGMTLNDIAEKHGMSVDMLVAEFKKGIQTEMEHTTDREMAKEITLDHLFEDPQYYTKLATVEEYVDDKGVEHVAAALPQTEEEPIKEGEDSEETLEGLKEMAMGDLERIADYANMILERMGQGQNLDSWMYSQITLAVDQLNSVHDTMDGTDGKKEEIKEEKVYIDYLNKQKGFKQDRIKFNSYEEAVKWARKNFEKFNPDMIKYESVNEYNVNKKFGSKYDIGAGSMGSGTIFWNRAEEEFGDYKKIAHVSDSGRITFYDKKLPSFVKKHVEDYAKTQNESVNENLDNYSKDAITDMIINLSRYEGNEKLIADLKKILKQRTLGKLKKEQSVNEATEPEIISQIKNIAKTHQNNIVVDPKSGKKMRVDVFSASAIATVYDALSGSNQEKFVSSGLLGMQQMAMKLLKK
jgi:hypothetical protein